MNFEKTGIVIVNYNSAGLALKAAKSALATQKPGARVQVVIVDNTSCEVLFDDLVQRAEVKFADQYTIAVHHAGLDEAPTNAELVLIAAPNNGGFAAGCNIGIRFLQKMDTDLFVMLNPDTIMHRHALRGFADKLQDTDYGLVGATLLDIDMPHHVQALGGACLSGLSLLGNNIGEGAPVPAHKKEVYVERALSYPVGAAMAFRQDWLEEAGLMDERYFLFYEEADWVQCGKKKYKCGWASKAHVFHHRGAVAGSHLGQGHRSALADYHMVRSRMLYAKKWCPWLLPLLASQVVAQSLRRVLRRQWRQAASVLRGGLPFAPRLY